MYKKTALILPVLFFLILSCSKEEGEGGNSVITGKVLTKVYNKTLTHLIDSYYKPDADVFIVYGDDANYSDDFKTDWNGSYRFEYLRKGKYKVYAYSLDTTGDYESHTSPSVIEVNISGNNDEVVAGDIVIIETADYDDGTSSITGKVFVLDFNAERTNLLAQYYAADEDVFIKFGDDPVHFDDVKTYHDGTFQFSNLVKGRYVIYALSDPTGRQLVPVPDTIEITGDYQHIVLDEDLIIIK